MAANFDSTCPDCSGEGTWLADGNDGWSRMAECVRCDGKGILPDCGECEGQGVVVDSGYGQGACEACDGKGFYESAENVAWRNGAWVTL